MYGQRPAAGGRQFDGEGQAVEAGADVGDERQQVVGHFQGCARGVGAGHEQLGSVVGGQRGYRPHGLAGHAQRFATRGHEPQARAAAQQFFGHGGGGVDEMLAVVEHDHQLAITDHVREPGGVGYVERGRDRRGHRGGITDGRKLNDVATIGERDRFGARHLERQPRLPHSPRAHEGQKSMLRGKAGELAQLVVASDERGERFRDGSSPLDFGGA